MKEQEKENRFSGMPREEIYREARKQIARSALLALAALVVIAVACYAWFANNREVSAMMGQVSLGRYGYELASVGQDGNFDDLTVDKGTSWTSAFGLGTQTDGKQMIRWNMTDSDNLGNSGDETGIRPGSKGQLKFYIIPKQAGEINLAFHLEITPYDLSGNLIDAGNTLSKLLRGHLLFAYAYDLGDGETKALLDIASDNFRITIPNAKIDEPVEVTLDWFWSNLLSDAKEHPEYGTEISKWMENSSMTEWFFYNGVKPVDVNSPQRLLNDYYNNADQQIGDNIGKVIVQLTAHME